MPTFLVSPRMSPALAARVRRSVQGSGTGPLLTRSRKRALVRAGLVVTLVALAVTLGVSYRNAARTLEAKKGRLLSRIASEAAARPPDSTSLLARASRALVDAATAAASEPVKPTAEMLARIASRPSLYVRGRTADFTVAQHVAERAADTRKDALLACLLDPPADASLQEKVRAVYRGGAFARPPLERVRLLHDLVVTSTYLSHDFANRVTAAKQPTRVGELEEIFERAHLERLRESARAELLIYALDEPKLHGTLIEFDGASDHFIRIGVVDLQTAQALVRGRVHAEPRRFQEKSQARYLAGLSDCRAALDLREPEP